MEREHKTVKVNGKDFHVAIEGPIEAPVILFLHGCPELWYGWRHQMSYLAGRGYRAVALDLPGYGDSYAAQDIASYTCLDIIGDIVGLISVITADTNQEKVFVVGHDFGAYMAWYLCLFRPDKVKAIVNLSVPFIPIDPTQKLVEKWRAVYGDDYYICRVQKPGDIEAEFAEVGTDRVMKKLLTYRTPGPLMLPKDKSFWGPAGTPIPLPAWLSEEDVQYYVSKFKKTGFTGCVNYYRNFDRNSELLAPWVGSKVQVPAKFIIGDQDLVYYMPGIKEYINGEQFKKDVPLLEEVVIMEGIAHFINEEKPEEINEHIYEFIKKF